MLKQSFCKKLEKLNDRHQEIEVLMTDASVVSDQNRFRELSKEYAQLTPVVDAFKQYQKKEIALKETEVMREDDDPEVRELAEAEHYVLMEQLNVLELDLKALLLPRDPDDECNVYLEIRAGTGGDEASIFAGDLYRMYTRYAEEKKWKVEVMSESFGDHGGFKEVILHVIGKNAYGQLKFESGAHRVQRVPETESQGRIHTSACTVAVLKEAQNIDKIDVNESDLRIDTYRSSGAGGQHVNTTDSAVRITHVPSGVVVECQDERSQHKNRAKALALLQARLLAHEKEKQQREQAQTRRSLVGSGDRSERIRTYNFPQGRVTDHRINLTLYKLDEVMEGSLTQIIEPLVREHQADQLAALGEDE